MQFQIAAVALAVATFAAPAHAALNGSTVSVEYQFPDPGQVYPLGTATPPVFVVGAGVESVMDVEGVTFISIDFSDTGLNLLFNTQLSGPTWSDYPFNGLVFTSDAFLGLADIFIDPSSSFGAANPGQRIFTFSGNQLRLDWGGVSYADGDTLSLQFGGAVPEPATWAMFIAGFGLVGAAIRRRQPGNGQLQLRVIPLRQ